MTPTPDNLIAEVAALWPWEAVAVALAIAYLALAIRESVWCWAAGIASSGIYLVIFYGAALYMESVLQLFYIGISVYGWRHWAAGDIGGNRHSRASHSASPRLAATAGENPVGGAPAPMRVTTWSVRQHAVALETIAVLAAINGALLAAYTPAALPYFDALIAWGSVVTTWMVARKVLENWVYWFVIDGLSVYIYMRRGLWLTSGLFTVYLVMIVIGYRAWRRRMQAAS